jgi:hypothetical protein
LAREKDPQISRSGTMEERERGRQTKPWLIFGEEPLFIGALSDPTVTHKNC